MDGWSWVLRVVVVLVVLKAFVWWLEPRMAFYPLSGIQETPADAGVPYRDLQIETDDGQRLHAWWIEHPQPRALVVFFHGNGGNLSLWLDILIGMHRRGFSALAVDYRGYGASSGSASEKGIYRDADATIRTFERQLRRASVPVVYWGRSIGAPVAAHAAARSAPDGVILETPMPDARSVLRSNPVLWLLSFLSSYTFPTSRFLQAYRGPLLVVHGDADSIVPFAAGRRVFDRSPSAKKDFVVIKGGDHNDLHVINPTLYWSRIDEFVSGLSAR